jgi:hypothetical protein
LGSKPCQRATGVLEEESVKSWQLSLALAVLGPFAGLVTWRAFVLAGTEAPVPAIAGFTVAAFFTIAAMSKSMN